MFADYVRPIISFAIVGAAIYLAITGKMEPELLVGWAPAVIGFYFGERAALRREEKGK